MLPLPYLMLLAQPPPPPRTVPGVEVRMEAPALGIPPLPRTLAEARKDFARTRKDLDRAFREAQAYLAARTAELASLGALGPRIAVPAPFVQEGRDLVSFVFDAEFLGLEDPVLDRWNAWQNALLARGLADPRESGRMASGLRLLSGSKAEVTDRTALGLPSDTLEVSWGGLAAPEATVVSLPRTIKFAEVLAVEGVPYAAHTTFGREASSFAEAQAGALLEAWEPLVRHLDQGAARLLELDRAAPPSADPGVRALRILARINFMERYRSTVWFCQVVWAHMASERIRTIQGM